MSVCPGSFELSDLPTPTQAPGKAIVFPLTLSLERVINSNIIGKVKADERLLLVMMEVSPNKNVSPGADSAPGDSRP